MRRELGRAPTPEELAERTGISLERVNRALKAAAAADPVSLETPLGGDDGDLQLGDLIEDEDAVQPLDAAIGSDLRETMTRILGTLTPREERVLRMRFGIGTKSDHTLDEIGGQFSVTVRSARSMVAALMFNKPRRTSSARSRWPCRSMASTSVGSNGLRRLPQVRSDPSLSTTRASRTASSYSRRPGR